MYQLVDEFTITLRPRSKKTKVNRLITQPLLLITVTQLEADYISGLEQR